MLRPAADHRVHQDYISDHLELTGERKEEEEEDFGNYQSINRKHFLLLLPRSSNGLSTLHNKGSSALQVLQAAVELKVFPRVIEISQDRKISKM